MASRPLLAFAAALAFVLPGGQTTASGESPAETINDVPDALTTDTAFRRSFGLRSDHEFVAESESAPGFVRSPYGVPLAPEELGDLQGRLGVQASLDTARALAETKPEFAGIYLDQLDGGKPVFMFTSEPDQYWDELAESLPAGTAFLVARVTHTYAELLEVARRISDDRVTYANAGVDIVGVGPDVRSNSVRVGVRSSVAEASASLAQYGEAVYVESDEAGVTDACTITSCGKAKAGLKIYRGTKACTSGVLGRRSNGNIVVLTAGHCFALNGGSSQSWFHDGTLAGSSSGNTWYDGADADSGFLNISSAWTPEVYNKILRNDGTTNGTVGYITHFTVALGQFVGAQVCRTGIGSLPNPQFPRCGQIELVDQSRVSCPPAQPYCSYPVIDHQWQVDYDSTGGDSGGPYYTPDGSTNVTFYGTHTHSNVDTCGSLCHGWYSPGDWAYTAIFDHLGLLISYYCVNTDCV